MEILLSHKQLYPLHTVSELQPPLYTSRSLTTDCTSKGTTFLGSTSMRLKNGKSFGDKSRSIPGSWAPATKLKSKDENLSSTMRKEATYSYYHRQKINYHPGSVAAQPCMLPGTLMPNNYDNSKGPGLNIFRACQSPALLLGRELFHIAESGFPWMGMS